jgi:hypothetical protein
MRLHLRSWTCCLCLISILYFSAAGCSPQGMIGGTVGGVTLSTLLGARSPTHEIQQVYYLGVFDPREQVPPSIYRLTVHGQSSFMSATKFASGWVPAAMADSLDSHIQFNQKSEKLEFSSGDNKIEKLQTGRRLVLFGPEGFREAPKDHRLVIVMGSSPEAYFQAVDEALGVMAGLIKESTRTPQAEDRLIIEEIMKIGDEQKSLTITRNEIQKDLK